MVFADRGETKRPWNPRPTPESVKREDKKIIDRAKKAVVEKQKQYGRQKEKKKKGGGPGRYSGNPVGEKHFELPDTSDVVVLKPVPVPVPVPEPPMSIAIFTQVPPVIAQPTAYLGDASDTAGVKVPWTIFPDPYLQVGTVLGALMMFIGKQLAISIGMIGVTALASRLNIDKPSTRAGFETALRFHTGEGAGRGQYLRPRPEGGDFAVDDADPHEDPHDWWEFWQWSF